MPDELFFFDGYKHSIIFWNDGKNNVFRITNEHTGKVIKSGVVSLVDQSSPELS